jgi:hypothetical protein
MGSIMSDKDTEFTSTHQPENKAKTLLTREQRIAQLEAKLDRERNALQKLADGQKIIIGGMMLALADHDDAARKRLIELLEKNVTREADLRRIKPLIAELKSRSAGNGTEKKAPPPAAQNKAAAATAGR